MFDALAVGDEYLEWVLVVATKMIFYCFPANGTFHGFFAIPAEKLDDIAIEIISFLWLWEYEMTLIDHAQYGQDIYDGG